MLLASLDVQRPAAQEQLAVLGGQVEGGHGAMLPPLRARVIGVRRSPAP